MKIQCNVCEAVEATVLCCADEAALCWACDEKVHAANKLAGKHQRVPLSSSSSSLPKCDICQEAAGFFFCLQDRALLCRKCDVAIHTANVHVSAHQRFLLIGIKVGLEPTKPGASSSSVIKSPSSGKTQETKSLTTVSRRDIQQIPLARDHHHEGIPETAGGLGGFVSTKVPLAAAAGSGGGGGSAACSIAQWQLDEFLGLTDFSQSYGYMDNNGSSKADSSKRGDSDSSSMMRSAEEELDDNVCLGSKMLETSWAVPEIPSPPTASGLYWPKRPHNNIHFDPSAFVPDISASALQHSFQKRGRIKKRHRQF